MVAVGPQLTEMAQPLRPLGVHHNCFPPVRGTDVKQTACPHINPAAILVATARKLQRVEAISLQYRYRQIAVAWNRAQRSNEVPHEDAAYGMPADAALISRKCRETRLRPLIASTPLTEGVGGPL
jgi:hypothetical protein